MLDDADLAIVAPFKMNKRKKIKGGLGNDKMQSWTFTPPFQPCVAMVDDRPHRH